MLSLRHQVAALLLIAAPLGLAACGESDVEREAREANDAITTTETDAAAVRAKAEELADQQAAELRQAKEDRQGLGKDLADNVEGAAASATQEAKDRANGAAGDAKAAADQTAAEVKAAADKAAAEAQAAAEEAAADAISSAQAEAEKIRQTAEEAIDDAKSDIENATK